jgi:hypothetical protein
MPDNTSTHDDTGVETPSARKGNTMAQALDQVQEILRGSRVRKVRIKLGDRVLKEIPVESAALTAIVIVVAAIVISQLHIEVVRDNSGSKS